MRPVPAAWALSHVDRAAGETGPTSLQREGYFVENDGTKRRFQLDEHYDVGKEKTVKPASEVLHDL